jgi:hypothetical protein
MTNWIVTSQEAGHEQILATYPDEPPPTRGNDRRDAFTRARHRLIELVSSEVSSGLYALLDESHQATDAPHAVQVEGNRLVALVVVSCILGCPERRLRYAVERR